jgi:hypothetical protein
MMARIGLLRALNRNVERTFDSTRKIRIGEAEAEKGSMKTVWIDIEEPWAGLKIAPP